MLMSWVTQWQWSADQEMPGVGPGPVDHPPKAKELCQQRTTANQWQLFSEYKHPLLEFKLKTIPGQLVRLWSTDQVFRPNNNIGRRRERRGKQTVGAIGSVRRWRPTRAHCEKHRWNLGFNTEIHFSPIFPMGTGICLRREILCFLECKCDKSKKWDWRSRMRKEEVNRGESVATRIKQFETANNDNNNKEKNNNNNSYSGSKRPGGTPNGFGSACR